MTGRPCLHLDVVPVESAVDPDRVVAQLCRACGLQLAASWAWCDGCPFGSCVDGCTLVASNQQPVDMCPSVP